MPKIRLNARDIHSFVGLYVSAMLLFLFSTGTLAVFSTELDWLTKPAMRVAPAGEMQSFGSIYDAVVAAHPDASVVHIERPLGRTHFADRATIVTPERKEYYVYVDPYDGDIQGVGTVHTIQNVVRSVHRRLYLPTKYGVPVVTAFVLPLTVSVVAGLFLYRRFWTGFFRWPRFGARRRAWLSESHRLMGVWALVFCVPLLLTSYWYMAESLGFDAPPPREPGVEVARDTLLPLDFDGAVLDRFVAQTQVIYPGLVVTDAELPRWRSQPVRISGPLEAVLVRPRANKVFFDPVTGNAIGQHRGEDFSAMQRVSEAADPIHFGTFGGWVTQAIWLTFGVIMTGLSGFGLWIYAERMRMRAERDAALAGKSGAALLWSGMGLGKWMCFGLLAIGFAWAVKTLLL